MAFTFAVGLGERSFSFRAIDSAGNAATSDSHTIDLVESLTPEPTEPTPPPAADLPSVEFVSRDNALLQTHQSCVLGYLAVERETCLLGDVEAARELVLWGDVHAAQWGGSAPLLTAEPGPWKLPRKWLPWTSRPGPTGFSFHSRTFPPWSNVP